MVDRSTSGDWLLTALGAVFIVALVVLLSALAYGLSRSEANETTARGFTAAPTVDAVAFNQAIRAENRVRLARYTASPSPTPAPTLTGVACTAEQVSATGREASAATGGQDFTGILIGNVSGVWCDLPAIESVDALDEAGNVIGVVDVSDSCSKWFCVVRSALPMKPLDEFPPAFGNVVKGTISILVGYSTGCWGRPHDYVCNPHRSGHLLLHFAGGLDLPVSVGIAWPDRSNASVWSLGVVGSKR